MLIERTINVNILERKVLYRIVSFFLQCVCNATECYFNESLLVVAGLHIIKLLIWNFVVLNMIFEEFTIKSTTFVVVAINNTIINIVLYCFGFNCNHNCLIQTPCHF